MKFATLKQGGRDGTLVVVSRDLTRCRAVPAIARSLQAALDDWQACEPQLRQVYQAPNSGAGGAQPFDQAASAWRSGHGAATCSPSSSWRRSSSAPSAA